MRTSDVIRLLSLAVDAMDAITGGAGKSDGPAAPVPPRAPSPRERRKRREAAARRAAAIAAGEKEHDVRFSAWLASVEGRRVTRSLAVRVLHAPSGIADATYDMGDDRFTIGSISAGATLTGTVDPRTRLASVTLRQTDGRSRSWLQKVEPVTAGDAMLEDFGEGPFDDDERLVASLLKENLRPGWPGRAYRKVSPWPERLARAYWDQLPVGAQGAPDAEPVPLPAQADPPSRIGHWLIDRTVPRLVRDDGAYVAFLGVADNLASDIVGRWTRFEARLDGRATTLLVEQHYRFFGGARGRNEHGRRLAWRVDFPASFAASGDYPVGLAQWCRWRDLVGDALCCWPTGTAAGPQAETVGLQGAWSEGAWRPDRFEVRETVTGVGTSMPERGGGPGAEQVWRFVPQTSRDNLADTMRALGTAKGRELAELVARRIAEGPSLVSGDRALVPIQIRHGHLRFIYVDEELITDRLGVSWTGLEDAPLAEWFVFEHPDVLIGSYDRATMTPLVPDDGAAPGWTNFDPRHRREGGDLPTAALGRIRESLSEALFLWQDGPFALASPSGELKTFGPCAPKAVKLRDLTMTAGRPTPGSVTIARQRRPGWFGSVFDPACQASRVSAISGASPLRLNQEAMRARFDGCRWTLGFVETVSGAPTATQRQTGWWCVGDGQDEWPLLVSRLVEERGLISGRWSVDHEASLRRWREVTGRALPSWGWWWKMQRFAVEALLFWPDHPLTGLGPNGLLIEGGMLDGAWRAGLTRQVGGVSGTVGAFHEENGPVTLAAPVPWIGMPGPLPECTPPDLRDSPVAAPLDASAFIAAHPGVRVNIRSDGAAIALPVGFKPRESYGQSSRFTDYRDGDIAVRFSSADETFHPRRVDAWLDRGAEGAPALVRDEPVSETDVLHHATRALFERLRATLEGGLLPGEQVRYVDQLAFASRNRATIVLQVPDR